jgi:transcriptional regulator GlxA family with amidase domain
MQIACVLYRPFTALDLVGAYQVFTSWPGATVELVAETREIVMDDVGVMAFTPTATFDEVWAPDVVVIPGSGKPLASLNDEVLLAWLRSVEPTAKWMTSVCTGSGLLAAAGLLTGRQCATHWVYRDIVSSMGAEVLAERYVFSGKFVTGGGVTAGIDMALALTAREFDDATAKIVQLGMEYDPKPPFPGGTLETSEPAIVEVARSALLAAATEGMPA